MPISLILTVLLILFVLTMLAKTVRVIPQGRAGIVERLGKFHAVLNPGLHIVIPVVDRVLPLIDLREQVVSFPSQSVITEDNLVVGIDTVVYFQVTDPKAATYEITNYIRAVDELTSATLRNVVGGLNLEQTLTSRDQINAELRGVLDSTTGRWGLRVSRVDIKEIQPPASIQDSMEKQMRAERDRRAAILTAEGQKQSDILTAEGESRAAILRAEGEKQAQILRAEGDAQSAILRANGEAEAVQKVFAAIHESNPSQQLLTYQYLQNPAQARRRRRQQALVHPDRTRRCTARPGQRIRHPARIRPCGRTEEARSGGAQERTAGTRKLRHQRLNAKSNA